MYLILSCQITHEFHGKFYTCQTQLFPTNQKFSPRDIQIHSGLTNKEKIQITA